MALHLPILNRCNIQCVFCSAVGRGGGYELADLKRAIDADRTGHVQISGGDPMLRPELELLELLAHCKKRGKIVELQTNATTVTRHDPKRLRQMIGLTDYFNVNFSAHEPELDYKVTGSPGAFAWRERGVRMLLELGAKVRLTYIVHTLNYRHCADFLDYARENLPGIAWVQLSFVKGMGRAKGSRAVIPRFRVAAPHVNRALDLSVEKGPRCVVDHIPVCFVRRHMDRHVDYQKMIQESPGVHLEEKRKVADCDGCSLRPHCPGPRRDYIELYKAL